jgi:hypothetical protein
VRERERGIEEGEHNSIKKLLKMNSNLSCLKNYCSSFQKIKNDERTDVE